MPDPKAHIVRITSNVKGAEWTRTLTEKTLVIGDNGSGKSAIVQALALATTGGAPDIFGREWVRDKRLFDLFSGESMPSARADWSDGGVSSWYGTGQRNGREATFVGQEVRDMLRKSDAGLLQALADIVDPTAPSAHKAEEARTKKALAEAMAHSDWVHSHPPGVVQATGCCRACGATTDAETRERVAQRDEVARSRAIAAVAAARQANARARALAESEAAMRSTMGRDILRQIVPRASELMPAELSAHLSTGDAVRLSVARNGQARTAPSGGEWALLCAALGAALGESLPGPAIVVPEDRGLSPSTLTLALESLALARAQIIVATTTEPTDLPLGWSVIRL